MKNLWKHYSYAIILICLSFSIVMFISLQSSHNENYLKIEISKGDSLWKIAKNYSNEHSLSNAEFVAWVEKHNDIEADRIYPGEKIFIPVKKKPVAIHELASAESE